MLTCRCMFLRLTFNQYCIIMKLSRLLFRGLESILATFLLCAVSCSEQDAPTPPVADQEEEPVHIEWGENMDAKSIELNSIERSYVGTQTDFALKMYKGLTEFRSENQPNLLASPLSTSILMSIMAEGANGNTRSEIIKALGFGDADMKTVNKFNARLTEELSSTHHLVNCDLANSLWFDRSIDVKADFLKTCRDIYNLDAQEVDLHTEATRQAINDWASDKTNGLIKEPVTQIPDPETASILANSTYFRALWHDPFDKNLTKEGPFHNLDGTVSKVPFMHAEFRGRSLIYDNYCVVSLPFMTGNFSMYFILPDLDSNLKDAMDKVNLREVIERILDRNESPENTHDVVLYLPKFEITNMQHPIQEVLRTLGVKDAFDIANADFSNFTQQRYAIQNIFQDTKISIDENGVEAAAFTIDEYGSGFPENVINARLNVPFAFFISENSTGSVIFIGDVTHL